MHKNTLDRFKKVQEKNYHLAYQELRNSKKRTHWMWYIFPQIHGLGFSETSKYYEIKSIIEAKLFLNDKYLYHNLVELCYILLNLEEDNPIKIFGDIDALKLKSSMTLFSYISHLSKEEIIKNFSNNEEIITIFNHKNEKSDIFDLVLEKFFNKEKDYKTINILLNDLYLLSKQTN